jgi:type I restriction enzyme S subunit
MIAGKLNSVLLNKSIRLEAKFFLNENAINSRKIELSGKPKKYLHEVAKVFNPPIFKRQFCQKSETAVPYCQSSDVGNGFEGSAVFINRKQVEKINALVKENWILVTGFGLIGSTRLVNELGNEIAYANNTCRIIANQDFHYGYLYAFLSSKYGKSQLNKNASGSVVKYIEAPGIEKTLIPLLSEEKRKQIHKLVEKAKQLRVEANKQIEKCKIKLLESANLAELKSTEYESFGSRSSGRPISVFAVKNISSVSLAAFNHSERIEKIKKRVVRNNKTLKLKECLTDKQFFHTGSFKRLEIKSSKAIHLINQSDIFDFRISGKYIAPFYVKNQDRVTYGEILIAGVGTLGESETFCRVLFAGEELENQLVSGEFIRMKATNEVPPGYLYIWLSTDYAFRMIRATQAGTKLCRPILKLLSDIPVPIIDKQIMNSIDKTVKEAHSKKFEALQTENKAIKIIEDEIDIWHN